MRRYLSPSINPVSVERISSVSTNVSDSIVRDFVSKVVVFNMEIS